MKKTPPSDQQKKTVSHGNLLIKWNVPEYEYHEKGPIWKFFALIVVSGLVVYGVLADSYAFAIVVMLFSGVYFLVHRKPREIEIRITDMGITVDHRFYEHANIRNFWILYKPGEVETLNLRLTKNVVKEVTILLGDQDPAEVREILSRFVSELAGKEESFVDWLTRKMRL